MSTKFMSNFKPLRSSHVVMITAEYSCKILVQNQSLEGPGDQAKAMKPSQALRHARNFWCSSFQHSHRFGHCQIALLSWRPHWHRRLRSAFWIWPSKTRGYLRSSERLHVLLKELGIEVLIGCVRFHVYPLSLSVHAREKCKYFLWNASFWGSFGGLPILWTAISDSNWRNLTRHVPHLSQLKSVDSTCPAWLKENCHVMSHWLSQPSR